ncbi:sigma-54-dependent Fis family transcriptional regulator [Hyphomicrobium sp.]|uniref:sigma-54-dependent Fis family transcriptional regulator n=1 Tax=Hyphomicrobium sp. TaxID=82 RepID=UPI0025BEA4AC|nr:sigma-54-dependent Fis family transcriptional regulator [Hyphomicrobium sp.]MCC7250795.1 sigma-54-dependent Fis family transcriptional regulator [Hyphomicrobium sp.]
MNVLGKGKVASQSPEYAHTRRIFDEITRSESGPTEDMPSLIVSSWKRCVSEYKLDRAGNKGPEIVTINELRRAIDPLDLLRHVARPEIERLMGQVAASSYVVMLADPNGIALDVWTSSSPDRALRRVGVCEGAAWAEMHAGTNGVGTSIASRRAVTIHRSQHFFFSYSNLTCTAVPIFDPKGQVIAALDASSVADLPQEMQPLVCELVIATARRIERRYFLERNRNRAILRVEWGLDGEQDGSGFLIALDDNGCAVEVQGSGGADLRRIDCEALIGQPLSDFMEINWQDVGRSAKSAHIERIGIARLKDSDRPCFASMMALARSKAAASSKPASARASGGTAAFSGSGKLDLDALAGNDSIMREHVRTVRRLVNKNLPILLHGETGTGKEEFARGIHDVGSRASKPFVVIDCSSIPESLIESELFGYETGTFTGARREGRRGRIAEANGGTLFLDEIGDMPLVLQTRLLRVLAQGEVVPLGSAKPIKVDFNLICASHQDLPRMVSEGSFRQDLYYRIAGIRLELPALRARTDKEDVILGALAIEAAKMGLDAAPGISPSALKALVAHPWPGNMRELRLALRYALASAGGDEIADDRLPDWLSPEVGDAAGSATSDGPAAPDLLDVLERNRWCVSDAACELRVSRQTLYRWIKRQNLTRPS